MALRENNMKRPAIIDDSPGYFEAEHNVDTFTSGCALLDQVLGGGWAVGRVANVVGDKSTGKTLLAIEACTNFARKYPEGKIYYLEAEAAFDQSYAESLGLPLKRVKFIDDVFTVEGFFKSVDAIIKKDHKEPSLYIVDSLDALSDEAELMREINQATYGGNKAKQLSSVFRRFVKKVRMANMTVIIVSQVRDKIGISFGKSSTRSGGRALDFYASQVIWLAHLGRISKTRKKIQRVVGVKIRAKCEKNKISLPFRECEFPILFSFGVEDLLAGIEWLISIGRADLVFKSNLSAKKFVKRTGRLGREEYLRWRKRVAKGVRIAWREIERDFSPAFSKY